MNGYWFTKPYDAEGRRPDELWRMNAASVDKYASDEAKAWFYANGRVTVADLRDLVDRGVISDEPATYLEAAAVHGDDMRSRRVRPKRNRRAERDRAQAKRDVKAEAEQRALGGEPDGDGAPDSGAELDVTVDQRSHDGMSDTTPAGIKPAFRASREERAGMAEGVLQRQLRDQYGDLGGGDGEPGAILDSLFRDKMAGEDVQIPSGPAEWGLYDVPGAEEAAANLSDLLRDMFFDLDDVPGAVPILSDRDAADRLDVLRRHRRRSEGSRKKIMDDRIERRRAELGKPQKLGKKAKEQQLVAGRNAKRVQQARGVR